MVLLQIKRSEVCWLGVLHTTLMWMKDDERQKVEPVIPKQSMLSLGIPYDSIFESSHFQQHYPVKYICGGPKHWRHPAAQGGFPT